MNDLVIFNYEGSNIRTINNNGTTWFVLSDVCDVLGIVKSRNVASRLDDDEKDALLMGTLGGEQKILVVNESGLYNVILRSDKPEAKTFKRWLTHEVLPSIRKHGLYATDELLADPDLLIKVATELKNERETNKRLEQENQKYRLIVHAGNFQYMGDFAKAMNWGRNRLYEFLREQAVFMPNSTMPYQRFCTNGYFEVKYTYRNGLTFPYAMVSPKGMDFIIKKVQECGAINELLKSSKNEAEVLA